MMTSSKAVASWGLKLPDLISRLNTIAVAQLSQPDDELLVSILLKQFDDKQIRVSPEFIFFVAKRIKRSFCAIREFVDLTDIISLKSKCDITIPVASKILEALDKGDSAELISKDIRPFFVGSD